VGIALFVRILMMHAVGGDPGNWAAFYGQRAAGSQEILNEFRGFVAAMGKQAVIAHANAQAAGNPPHHQAKDQGLPGKEENSGQGAQMESDHDGGDAPVDGLMKGAVVLDKSAEAHGLR
jgi:hypothetical protein